MIKTLVAVVLTEDQKEINAKLEALGYGPNTFSVPMLKNVVVTDADKPTHYGCNWIDKGEIIDRIMDIKDSELKCAIADVSEDSKFDGARDFERKTDSLKNYVKAVK